MPAHASAPPRSPSRQQSTPSASSPRRVKPAKGTPTTRCPRTPVHRYAHQAASRALLYDRRGSPTSPHSGHRNQARATGSQQHPRGVPGGAAAQAQHGHAPAAAPTDDVPAAHAELSPPRACQRLRTRAHQVRRLRRAAHRLLARARQGRRRCRAETGLLAARQRLHARARQVSRAPPTPSHPSTPGTRTPSAPGAISGHGPGPDAAVTTPSPTGGMPLPRQDQAIKSTFLPSAERHCDVFVL